MAVSRGTLTSRAGAGSCAMACTLLQAVMLPLLVTPAVTAFTHAPFTKSSIVRMAFFKHPLAKCFHNRKVSRAGDLALSANIHEGSGKQSTMENVARSASQFLNHEVLINIVTEKTEMSVAKKLLQVINWAYRGKPGVPGWTGRSCIMGSKKKLLVQCRDHV